MQNHHYLTTFFAEVSILNEPRSWPQRYAVLIIPGCKWIAISLVRGAPVHTYARFTCLGASDLSCARTILPSLPPLLACHSRCELRSDFFSQAKAEREGLSQRASAVSWRPSVDGGQAQHWEAVVTLFSLVSCSSSQRPFSFASCSTPLLRGKETRAEHGRDEKRGVVR